MSNGNIEKRLQWFAKLNGESNLEERFLVVADAGNKLASYQEFHKYLREHHQQLQADGIWANDSLRERTAEAEHSLRITIKEGLDILNSCRNCNLLGDLVRQVTASSQVAPSYQPIVEKVQPALSQARIVLQQRYPDADFSFMDQIVPWLKNYDPEVRCEQGALQVRVHLGQGEMREFIIEDRPQPGFLGTISSRDFFNPITSGIAVLPPVMGATVGGNSQEVCVVDAYGALVGSANFAKNQIYRHLRQVETQGISSYTGNTGALIIIGWVIAIACFLAGTIINIGCSAEWWTDEHLCNWGGWLIMALGLVIGGILAVAGGYGLGIGLADTVPIDPERSPWPGSD